MKPQLNQLQPRILQVSQNDSTFQIRTKFAISNAFFYKEKIYITETSTQMSLIIIDFFTQLQLNKFQLPYSSWSQFVSDSVRLFYLQFEDDIVFCTEIFSDNQILTKEISIHLDDSSFTQATLLSNSIYILSNQLLTYMNLENDQIIEQLEVQNCKFVLNVNNVLYLSENLVFNAEKLQEAEQHLIQFNIQLQNNIFCYNGSEIQYSYIDEMVYVVQSVLNSAMRRTGFTNYFNQELNMQNDQNMLKFLIKDYQKITQFQIELPNKIGQPLAFLYIKKLLALVYIEYKSINFIVITTKGEIIQLFKMDYYEHYQDFQIRKTQFGLDLEIETEKQINKFFSLFFYDRKKNLTQFICNQQIFHAESGKILDCRILLNSFVRMLCYLIENRLVFINLVDNTQNVCSLPKFINSFFQLTEHILIIFCKGCIYLIFTSPKLHQIATLSYETATSISVLQCDLDELCMQLIIQTTQGTITVSRECQFCDVIYFVNTVLKGKYDGQHVPLILNSLTQQFLISHLQKASQLEVMVQFCKQQYNIKLMLDIINDNVLNLEVIEVTCNYLQMVQKSQLFKIINCLINRFIRNRATLDRDQLDFNFTFVDITELSLLQQLFKGILQTLFIFDIPLMIFFLLRLGYKQSLILSSLKSVQLSSLQTEKLAEILGDQKQLDLTKLDNVINNLFGLYKIKMKRVITPFSENIISSNNSEPSESQSGFMQPYYQFNQIYHQQDLYSDSNHLIQGGGIQNISVIQHTQLIENSTSSSDLPKRRPSSTKVKRKVTLQPRYCGSQLDILIGGNRESTILGDLGPDNSVMLSQDALDQASILFSQLYEMLLQKKYADILQMIDNMQRSQYNTIQLQLLYKQLRLVQLFQRNMSIGNQIQAVRYLMMVYGVMRQSAVSALSTNSTNDLPENFNHFVSLLLINSNLLFVQEIEQDITERNNSELDHIDQYIKEKLLKEYNDSVFIQCDLCKGDFNLYSGRCNRCGVILKICNVKLKPLFYNYHECPFCDAAWRNDCECGRQCPFCGLSQLDD